MTSSRGLLRGMSITGSTQVASIFMSIIRMKVLALLLGPAGVGVLSIYSNLIATGSTLAGLGLGNSGVRQLAQTRQQQQQLDQVRYVLLAANLIQGALAMVGVWLFRVQLADWLFDDADYATEVGLIGIAIMLTVLGASQTTLLRGMRRIGDLGRVTIYGAIAATIGGIGAVLIFGMDGLIVFVLTQPMTAAIVALFYTRKLPAPSGTRPSLIDMWRTWKPMAQLGSIFMLGGLATTLTLLIVRGLVVNEAGVEGAGQFAAAWGITMTYVGFLLSAMSMDYYPRLAEIIHKREDAVRLMNEQAQIGMAIGGPILLLLIGLAPLAIAILYSADFQIAIILLQWQTAGNFFKLASWPLAFSFAAGAYSRIFLLTQLSFNLLYLPLVWFGLPIFGLEIAGIAFLICYAFYYAIVLIAVRQIFGFRWDRLSLILIAGHLILAAILLTVSFLMPLAGAALSILLFTATAFIGVHILVEKIGPHRHTNRVVRIYARLGWPVKDIL